MRSTPTLGRAICFTQSINLNVKLIQEHPHRNTQNNVWPNIWAPCDPVKLTPKVNHHNFILTNYICKDPPSKITFWGSRWTWLSGVTLLPTTPSPCPNMGNEGWPLTHTTVLLEDCSGGWSRAFHGMGFWVPIRLGNAALNNTGQVPLPLAPAEALLHEWALWVFRKGHTALLFQGSLDQRNPCLFFLANLWTPPDPKSLEPRLRNTNLPGTPQFPIICFHQSLVLQLLFKE